MLKYITPLFIALFCLLMASCVPLGGPGSMPAPINYSSPKYKASVQKLPQTTALDKELRQMHSSLNATSGRVNKAKTTVTNGRYAAEAAVKMIDQIKSVENQIQRLDQEVYSISRIPQFKLLKPVSTGISRLEDKIEVIRKKAETLRDKKIKPAIKKMKSLEEKLTKLKSGLDSASVETATAVRHLNFLRNIVITQNYPAIQVRVLEAASKTTRYPVRPAQKALYEFDSACTDPTGHIPGFSKHKCAARLTS